MGREIFKFPSVFREAKPHERRFSVEWEGERWIVGERALSHKRGCYYIRTVDELVKYYPLFIREVERRAGKTFNRVVVSLPLDVYVSERAKMDLGKTNLISTLERSFEGKVAGVGPQGIAGLQTLLEQGKVKPKSTLLIDGGFNTVNTAVLDDELNVLTYKTFTDEIGIRNLIEDFFVEELVKSGFSGISTNLVVLKEIFLSGRLDTGFNVVDITPEKERALERFLQRFFRKITGEIKRSGTDYDQIVILGGLSYYLSPDLIETTKDLYIAGEGAEFLNVQGLPAWFSAPVAVDLGFGDCKVMVEKGKKEDGNGKN